MRMRISVTDLDALQYYYDSEDMTLKDFLRRILKLEEPGEKARAGSAFHKILEHISRGVYSNGRAHQEGIYEHDGYVFDAGELDIRLGKPDVHEVKLEKEYQVGQHTVTLVGQVDNIVGHQITEYKTTHNLQMPRYMTSVQWRAYLAMLEQAQCVRFEFFHLAPSGAKSHYRIKEHSWSVHFRYPNVERDVLASLSHFVGFLEHMLRQGYVHLIYDTDEGKIRMRPGKRMVEDFGEEVIKPWTETNATSL